MKFMRETHANLIEILEAVESGKTSSGATVINGNDIIEALEVMTVNIKNSNNAIANDDEETCVHMSKVIDGEETKSSNKSGKIKFPDGMPEELKDILSEIMNDGSSPKKSKSDFLKDKVVESLHSLPQDFQDGLVDKLEGLLNDLRKNS